MFISMLAGALTSALALFLWHLIKKAIKKKERASGQKSNCNRKPGDRKAESAQSNDESGREDEYEKNKEDERRKRNDLIDRLVASIVFASREKISNRFSKGARPRKSIVPTGNYNVRPIRTPIELPNLLPASHLLDDDQYFARLASSQLMVGEFLEYESKARNTLVVAVDASGSMEESGRYQWAIGLTEKLTDRCIEIGAEMFLIVFTSKIRISYHVKDKASAGQLKESLGKVLYPDGGTDLNLAIAGIFKIIDEGDFTEARALLVTDGTEGVDEKEIEKGLKKRKIFLHTVCIAGDRDDLKRVSNKYDQLGMYS